MKESWVRLGVAAGYLVAMLSLLTPEAKLALGTNWGLAFAPAMLGGLVAWVNLTRVE